jgi:hypothetical protein
MVGPPGGNKVEVGLSWCVGKNLLVCNALVDDKCEGAITKKTDEMKLAFVLFFLSIPFVLFSSI